MIIDAHNHPDWHGHDRGHFLANTARYQIDKTWLLSSYVLSLNLPPI